MRANLENPEYMELAIESIAYRTALACRDDQAVWMKEQYDERRKAA